VSDFSGSTTLAPLSAAAQMGIILSVKGSQAEVGLPARLDDSDPRATVGSFLTIAVGSRRLVGMITEVHSRHDYEGVGSVARIDLMGEFRAGDAGDRFYRGVSNYPAIGDGAWPAGAEELRLIYATPGRTGVVIGALHDDATIEARVLIDNLLTKHFAVLGSTGVGKSSGVAVIVNEILEARPDLRVFLLDVHNEFARSFGAKANVLNAFNLKLPFWLFNFEEFVDVLYGGRPGVDEEIDILAEHIPTAKGLYLAHKISQERGPMRRVDPKRAGYTVDTPVPYVMQDLVNLIDERMGKLENRATRMHYHRLLQRIETLRADPRYGFMFENANVGGDTMADILAHLFRLEPEGQPMTVMQVAGLPVEVVDAVVCVVARLAFDFGLWSDGASPMLFVCEEAHRFAPADRGVGFAPTRRALMRIAKEGRKYGVYLGLVTQRPGEIDPTIISQCNTLFAMRLANERDQAMLRSSVIDAVANLLAFVPSLATREVVAVGEGLPLPARITFKALPPERVPRSETFESTPAGGADGRDRSFVKLVVERWRNACGGGRILFDESAPPPGGPQPLYNSPAPSSAAPPLYAASAPAPTSVPAPEPETFTRAAAGGSANDRLEQLRAQILRRAVASPSGKS